MWPLDLTLVMTLTVNFQGQIWNSLYLSNKWFDCHEMKSKHIYWNLGIKCDYQVWPWPWPWPWIFKVKYGISISRPIMVQMARNEKQTYRLNSKLQLWASGLTMAWPWKTRCKDLPDRDRGDIRCGHTIDSSTYYFMIYGLDICRSHWGWLIYIYVSKLTFIGSDDGLSPSQH